VSAEVSIEHLSKFYGKNNALYNLNFNISPNEIVGVLGPNGAGKSTLFRILCGIIPASEGKIYINHLPLTTHRDSLKSIIGYMPEHYTLPDAMRVEEFLQAQACLKQVKNVKKTVQEVMEICDLHRTATQKLIGTLSHGTKQRVGIADAILNDPQLVILDEPSVGLDPQQVENFRLIIQRISSRSTVIMATHILPEIESICNHLLIVHQGQLVGDGTFQSLYAKTFPNKRYQLKMLHAINAIKSVLNASPFGIQCDSVVLHEDATECTFEYANADSHFESELIAWLLTNGYKVQQFSEVPPNLNHLFFKMTQFPWKS